jgi:hypothetical protein
LIALGPVLCVIDHEIFAAGEGQRIVQRLRLGARVKLRHDDDLDIAGKMQRACRRDRLLIDFLEDDLDVELGGRPVAVFRRWCNSA